jgi:hypothetical protein
MPLRTGDGSNIIAILQHRRRESAPHSPYSPLMPFPVQPSFGSGGYINSNGNGMNGRGGASSLSPSPIPPSSLMAMSQLGSRAHSDASDDGINGSSRSRTPSSRSISGIGGSLTDDNDNSVDDDTLCASLAIVYANGWVQINRNDNDLKPIIFDSGLYPVTTARWNTAGEVLALGGCVRGPVIQSSSSLVTTPNHAAPGGPAMSPNGGSVAAHRPTSLTITPSLAGAVSVVASSPTSASSSAPKFGRRSSNNGTSFASSLSSTIATAITSSTTKTGSENGSYFIPSESSPPSPNLPSNSNASAFSSSSMPLSVTPSVSTSTTTVAGVSSTGAEFFIPGSVSSPPSPSPPSVPSAPPYALVIPSSSSSSSSSIALSSMNTNRSSPMNGASGASPAIVHFFSPTGQFLHVLRFSHTDTRELNRYMLCFLGDELTCWLYVGCHVMSCHVLSS